MKLTTLLLSGAAAVSAVTMNAAAAESGGIKTKLNGITYTYAVNSDGTTAEIISAVLPVSVKETVIPTEIDGYKITSVGEKAYVGSLALEQLTVPGSIESIGTQAFMSCNELREVTFEKGITAIPDDCFFSCPKLVTANFPDTLKSIGREAFFGCAELDTEIPESVTSIGKDALGMEADFHSQGSVAVYGFLLRGTSGSYAEKYAEENNIDFIDMNNFSAGDVNGDNTIDSSDASEVLAEYARVSTGKPSVFTKKQNIMGDLNADGSVDSSDASEILVIYARLSTGNRE